MKTAIQQLIEELEIQIVYSAQGKGDTKRTGDYRIGLRKSIQIAFDFLPIEKEQIKNAWISAWKDSMINPLSDEHYHDLAEEYYNQTYANPNNNT
jgi:hypothetical protein